MMLTIHHNAPTAERHSPVTQPRSSDVQTDTNHR